MADAGGVRAGGAFVELFLRDHMSPVLKTAEKNLVAFGQGLTNIGAGLVGIGAAVLTPLILAATFFASSGAALDDMSGRTGVAAEQLSALSYAAGQSGTSIEELEGGLAKMGKKIVETGEAGKGAIELVEGLTVSLADLAGKTPDQQMLVFADAIAGIEDPGKRTAAVMEVFGKSGTKLLPLFADGAAGIKKLTTQAKELGVVMSEKDIKAAAGLDDAWATLTDQGKALSNMFGAAIAPALTDLLTASQPIIAGIIKWIDQNRQLVVTVAAVAAACVGIGTALVVVGTTITLIGSSLGALAGLATFLAPIAMPIAAIAAAVFGLGLAFPAWQDAASGVFGWMLQQWQSLADFVGPIIGGIVAAVSAGDFGAAAEIAWLGIKVAWQHGVAWVEGLWVDFKERFLGYMPELWGAMEAAWGFIVGIWDGGVAAITEIWNVGVSFISDLWASLTGFLGDTVSGFTQLFGTETQSLADIGYNLVSLLTQAWAGLQSAWVVTTTFLLDTWTTVVDRMQTAWGAAQEWIAARGIEALGAAGAIDDVEGAKARLAEDFNKTNDAREKATNAELTARELAANKRLAEIEAQRKAGVEAIEELKAKARKEGAQLFAGQRAESQAKLTAAQAELNRALGRVTTPAKALEGTPEAYLHMMNQGKNDALGDLKGTNTFHGSIAGMLGGGGVQEQIRANTKQAADNTGKLVEKMPMAGMNFN